MKQWLACVLVFLMLFVAVPLFVAPRVALAQSVVKCGSIVEGEFTKNQEEQQYLISVSPGDQLTATVKPIGDALKTRIKLAGPTGVEIIAFDSKVTTSPTFKSGVLSARGIHTISVTNSGYYSENGGVGVYNLLIDCTLRDGTVIKAGDNARPAAAATTAATPKPSATTASAAGTAAPAAGTAAPAATTAATAAPVATAKPAFSGVGFPGLAPVDFSDVAKVPLPADAAINGAVSTKSGDILGFTITAKANDTLDLSLKRVSGNLNLGLVVLSSDSKVYFQTSLVTSESITTRLTLPTAGQYVIGVFRISLVEPAKPEATAFQVQGKLTSKP